MANKYADKAKAARRARERERACERKRSYATEAEAMQPGQRVYNCPHCSGWHRSAGLFKLAAKVRKRSNKS